MTFREAEIRTLHKDDALPSAPFLKEFKRPEDQCMIRRIEIMSKTPGKWNTMKAHEKKRSLDASREQEQKEKGIWLHRMDDLSRGKEKHIRWQKYRRLLGYLKHYLKKPLARKEERPLKVVG